MYKIFNVVSKFIKYCVYKVLLVNLNNLLMDYIKLDVYKIIFLIMFVNIDGNYSHNHIFNRILALLFQ